MKAYQCRSEPSSYEHKPRRPSQRVPRESRCLEMARCPLCRLPLVAQMSGCRPRFPCACDPAGSRAR
jgi:hypothetical protein